ncbi:MAG: UbiX family flavin prenyltransferase [Prevotellaceae bacterium]|jgi:4-hydroxy-3-polyprenylbenzoate decarboxylase|nr:UbiX family flavin prenyltransferase [Prevotellaceae bacterium]
MGKIAIGVTGASGSVYAMRLFDKLVKTSLNKADIAVVFSEQGEQVFRYEAGDAAFEAIPFQRYNNRDFFAPFASGSSLFDTFIIIPCSMGTLARIASGLAGNLISRAADVMLKERRRLILVTRETPLNLIHIRNMEQVTEAGGIICPASPSFYSRPTTLEQAVDTVVDRVLSLVSIPVDTFRWSGNG